MVWSVLGVIMFRLAIRKTLFENTSGTLKISTYCSLTPFT